MTTVLVSAPIANKPFNGGNAWTHLSYVEGFRKLGLDVYFVEQLNAGASVDAAGRPAPPASSINRAYFKQVLENFGLQERMALISPDTTSIEGLSFSELLDVAGSAELLVNISGHLDMPQVLERVRRKIYVDLDPGFTQFWHAASTNGFRVPEHDEYFTIGENIGDPDCPIPAGGIRWRRTRQPVVLEDWPVCPPSAGAFTTIASWRGPFGPVTIDGRSFGSKVHEFRKYVEIPQRANAEFEIALDIHPADGKDRDLLLRNGWRLADPAKVAPDLPSFRSYVQSSGAEFSVAQEMYVNANSGWFSDRTTRYLASGKPVLVQETGFSRRLPSGVGLLAFSSMDEAVTGVRQILGNYAEHATAARRIAEEYFDSNRVLGELLAQVV